MSMSTFVYGIKPPNAEWKKMKAVWDACCEANIEVPEEVREFFGDESPDPSGVLVDLKEAKVARPYHEEGEGFEVDIDSLPKGVKTIRFVNTW